MLKLRKGLRIENLSLPLKQALPLAAELGAEGVEVNARTELRAAEMSGTAIRHFKKLLQDYNLKVCSVKFPTRRGYNIVDDLERRIDATKAAMKLAYNLGCGHVSNFVGQIVQQDSENDTTMLEALTDLGMYGQRIGARLAIQTGPADGETLKTFIDRLPAASVAVDFDPAELIINKQSPSETLKLIKDHVVHFRARDAVIDLSAGQGIPVQLGRGSVDLPELLSLLEEVNYNGFITIDQPQTENAFLENGQSLEYLENLFK